MPNNTQNPFGQVALGQEGSGFAQVFQPYDGAKFDMAKIQYGEAKKEQAKKDIAELKKVKPEFEKLDEYWKTVAIDYSNFEQKIIDRQVNVVEKAAELQSLDVTNPNNREKAIQLNTEVLIETGKINTDVKRKTEEYKTSLQHQKLYMAERSAYNNNQDKFSEQTAYNQDEFYNKTVDEQAKFLAENGGTTLEPIADYGTWRDKNINYLTKKGIDYGYSGAPKETENGKYYMQSNTTGKTYDWDELYSATLQSMMSSSGIITQIKGNVDSKLTADILNFTGKTDIKAVSKKEVVNYFIQQRKDFQADTNKEKDHIGFDFMQTLMPEAYQITRSTASRTAVNDGGRKVLTPQEAVAETTAGDTEAMWKLLPDGLDKFLKVNGINLWKPIGLGASTAVGAAAISSDAELVNKNTVNVQGGGRFYNPVSGEQIYPDDASKYTTFGAGKTGAVGAKMTRIVSTRDITLKNGTIIKKNTALPKELIDKEGLKPAIDWDIQRTNTYMVGDGKDNVVWEVDLYKDPNYRNEYKSDEINTEKAYVMQEYGKYNAAMAGNNNVKGTVADFIDVEQQNANGNNYNANDPAQYRAAKEKTEENIRKGIIVLR